MFSWLSSVPRRSQRTLDGVVAALQGCEAVVGEGWSDIDNVDWYIDLGSVRSTVWAPDPDFFDVITRLPPEVLGAVGPVACAAWAIQVAAPVFARKGVVIRPSAAVAAVDGFPLVGLSSRPRPAGRTGSAHLRRP